MLDNNFIKTYPNFLTPSTFKRLKAYVHSGNFPWWYTETDHNPDDPSLNQVNRLTKPILDRGLKLGTDMMTHVMYTPKGIETNQFMGLLPIVDVIKDKEELGYGRLLKLKLNCYSNHNEHRHLYRHTDFYDEVTGSEETEFEFCTAVFCFTTDNGGTTVVDSDNKEHHFNTTENTLIAFNGKMIHGGFTQTDTNRRIILNINFTTNFKGETLRDKFYETGRY